METLSNPPGCRTGQYLTFRVARHDFAMSTCAVRGLLPARQMERVGVLNPALIRYFGPWTCGFASMRGTDFPVVDLRAKLGLSEGSYGRSPCIVVVEIDSEEGPRLVGFVADRISEVVQVRDRDFSRGKLKLSGRMRDVLNPDSLLEREPTAEEAIDENPAAQSAVVNLAAKPAVL